MRDAAPTAARGHNLVLLLPPSPVAASPALAGLLSRLGASVPGPPARLRRPARRMGTRGPQRRARDRGLRVQVAHGTSRATRRLRDSAVDLLITTPETAPGAAAARGAPRRGPGGGRAGVARELGGRRDRRAADAGPRQGDAAHRAHLDAGSRHGHGGAVCPSGADAGGSGAGGRTDRGPVRTVGVAWGRRVAGPVRPGGAARSDVAGGLDRGPERARGDRRRDRLARARGPGGHRATRRPRRSSSRSTCRTRRASGSWRPRARWCCWSRPAPRATSSAMATPRRPLRLPGALDAATTAAAARRAAIVRALEHGSARPRPPHAGTAVRAARSGGGGGRALRALDQRRRRRRRRPRCPTSPRPPRVFVGVGKKDGATVNDLVAVLTKDVRVERGKIGRVELRDAFSLVECRRRTPSGSPARSTARRSGGGASRPGWTGARRRGRPRRRPATPRRTARPPDKR